MNSRPRKKNIAGKTVRNVNKKITRAGASLGKNSGLFDGIIRDSDSDDETKEAVMLYNVGGEIHADSQLAYHHDTMEVDPSMIPRPGNSYDTWHRMGMNGPTMNAGPMNTPDNQYYTNYYYQQPSQMHPQYAYRPQMDYVMFEPDHETNWRHVDTDEMARRYGNYYHPPISPQRDMHYQDTMPREPQKELKKPQSLLSLKEEHQKSPPVMTRPPSAMSVVPQTEKKHEETPVERENAFKRSSKDKYLPLRARSRSNSQEYVPTVIKEARKDKKDKKSIFVDSPQGPSAFSLQGLRSKLKKKPKLQSEEVVRDQSVSSSINRGRSPSRAEQMSVRSRPNIRASSLSTIRSFQEDHEEQTPVDQSTDWSIWGAVAGAYGIAAGWTGYAWEGITNAVDREKSETIEEEPSGSNDDQRPASRLSMRSLYSQARSPSRASIDSPRKLSPERSPEKQKNKLKEVMKLLVAQPSRDPSRSPTRTRTPSRSSSVAPTERSMISARSSIMTSNETAIDEENPTLVSHFVNGARACARLSLVLVPLDAVADAFPSLQNLIVIVELFLLLWLLYQVSIIIETVALAVKAVCMPVIVISRFIGLNR